MKNTIKFEGNIYNMATTCKDILYKYDQLHNINDSVNVVIDTLSLYIGDNEKLFGLVCKVYLYGIHFTQNESRFNMPSTYEACKIVDSSTY